MFSRAHYNRDDAQGGGASVEDGGSPFDQAMDSFIRSTDLPGQTQTEQPQTSDTGEQILPSDPRYKRQQQERQTQQPQQPPVGNNQPRPPQPQPQQQQRPQQPNNGDLLDAQGNVIARAGTERRLYTDLQRARGEVTRLTNDINTLRAENTGLREASETMTRLGLSSQDAIGALNFMAMYRADPLKALKEVLTAAQAAGHNVASLFEGAPQGLDPAAIRRMVNEAVAPLVSAQTEQHQLAQARETARQQAEAFFAENPEAQIHDQALARLLTAYPNMTLPEAHWRLKAWALERGLDFYQPLEPQIAAQRGGGNGTTVAPQTSQPANRSALPASRGVPPDGSMTDMGSRRAPTAETSNRDIVREAMREHGFEV